MLLIYIASLILYRYGLFFFLHDTPTTEIYTYGHTLSLHDALPIYCIACAVSLENHGRPGDALPARLRASVAGIRAAFAGRPRQGLRQGSEEHTSELQSLMRISYAVFCLKKKLQAIIHNRTTDYYNHEKKQY